MVLWLQNPRMSVFYSTAAILVAEAIVFFIFGQGEMQPWNGKVIPGAAPVGHWYWLIKSTWRPKVHNIYIV